MKFQLLATVLIASISSTPAGINRNLASSGSKSLYLGDDVNNFGSSDQYGSENYEVSQLGEEDSLEEQNLEYQNDLADLFNQIEELNSFIEGGDNFNMGSLKTTAKKIWSGAKKVYRSPIGQAAVGAAKILL